MRILLALLFSFIVFSATAQNVKDIFVNVSDNGKPVAELLHEIEARQGVDFIFDEKKLQALTVHGITHLAAEASACKRVGAVNREAHGQGGRAAPVNSAST